MQSRLLTEEDLRETFNRAREIAEQSAPLATPSSELEHYLQAAEEMGIPREATLQALRERTAVSGTFSVGESVFAPSLDGFWYIAEVVSLGDHSAKVRFLSGGEHTCAVSDLRPLSFVPGRKLQGDVKGWGWYGIRVERFNAEKNKQIGRAHV